MRLLVPLFLILFLIFLLRSILQGLRSSSAKSRFDGSRPQRGGSGVKMGKMEKDPVCGTYVDIATSVRGVFAGETKHFCSQDCLNKYKRNP
ncbi:MAG: YHS domain-containing protein [Acidimicrobiia bacterium]|nr:YHS domain-containing protein [Acidimicrobiia bacterium]